MARTAHIRTRPPVLFRGVIVLKGLVRYFVLALLAAFVMVPAAQALAANDVPGICDRAAIYAAQKTGVPVSVLQAISLTETGRKHGGDVRPWPWTVNMEGKGVWFETADQAKAYVYKHFKRGARSFDVGCFQINYKWHGHKFESLAQMFEPKPNALYAAKFLMRLYREKGDWKQAAGAYHSRTKKYANKYAKKFQAYRATILAKKSSTDSVTQLAAMRHLPTGPAAAKPRVNQYPLLQNSGHLPNLGSLSPIMARQDTRRFIVLGNENG